VAEWLVCCPVSLWFQILASALALKTAFNCRKFSDLLENFSCTITPGSMSMFNCEIYQRGIGSPPGSIPVAG